LTRMLGISSAYRVATQTEGSDDVFPVPLQKQNGNGVVQSSVALEARSHGGDHDRSPNSSSL
jgi:hypothetical protein